MFWIGMIFKMKLSENMAFKIVITPKARIDKLESIEWCNSQASGLGKRFYQDIQKQYKILRQNP